MKQLKFENLYNSITGLYLKLDRIEKLMGRGNAGEGSIKEDLLTIEDAAKLLKLSVATIYTKVSKNEIPFNKQGKRLYFYRTELMDWIKTGRVKTISEINKEVELKINLKGE